MPVQPIRTEKVAIEEVATAHISGNSISGQQAEEVATYSIYKWQQHTKWQPH
jgi:hypothetical protein